MKKKRFRLAGVLEYRERLEEEASRRLAAIARRLAGEEARRLSAERDLDSTSELLRTSHRSLASDELRMHYLRLDFLSRSIHIHELTIMNIKTEVETARAELVKVAKERRVVERLKERHDARYTAETVRAEHSALDDANNRRPNFSLERLGESS
jgi:flagellar export protein FliJ